eukprot:TRINITY_DN31753_c0_g1_i1.p1 TRINITY_DN31753_c0_g1~~TRINITY_DN31753_c0_g1_i1.p1  ORF type:complete len:546 (-),score=120.83 TRINITY_DN31753_c0_g1_i1:67-1683(-)
MPNVVPRGVSAADALEETQQLLERGHAEILQVPDKIFDDEAPEAFSIFSKGVVRAEGCRELTSEQLLRDLGRKNEVLAFLAKVAERKRSYRRQVASVLKILLKGSSWLDVAAEEGLASSLPKEVKSEFSAELLHQLATSRGRSGSTAQAAEAKFPQPTLPRSLPRSPSEDSRLQPLEQGFRCLRDLGFDSFGDEALEALGQFTAGMGHVARSGTAAELAAVAALEPKLPLLWFLVRVHEKRRPQRARVTQVLSALLDKPTPQESTWRAAALGEPTLRTELEGIGVMEPVALPEKLAEDEPDQEPVASPEKLAEGDQEKEKDPVASPEMPAKDELVKDKEPIALPEKLVKDEPVQVKEPIALPAKPVELTLDQMKDALPPKPAELNLDQMKETCREPAVSREPSVWSHEASESEESDWSSSPPTPQQASSMITHMETPLPPMSARWMWRDAGASAGLLGIGLARMNPARWSQQRPVEDTLADLEQYLDGPASGRPVRLDVFGPGETHRLKPATVPEAVSALMDLLEARRTKARTGGYRR